MKLERHVFAELRLFLVNQNCEFLEFKLFLYTKSVILPAVEKFCQLYAFISLSMKRINSSEVEAFCCLGEKPRIIKNVECRRNLLIGYLMFLLAFFFIAAVTGGNPSVRGLAQS